MGDKISVKYGLLWNGQKVDRFQCSSTYRDRGVRQTFNQVVFADAKTHLPLRVQNMRDNDSWGDIWEYHYGPVAPDKFSVVIPAEAKQYDLVSERTRLSQVFYSSAIVLADPFTVDLLIRDSAVKPMGTANVYIGGVRYMEIRSELAYRIKNEKWDRLLLVGPKSRASLPPTDTISISIGDWKRSDAPIFRSGDVNALLTPYSTASPR